MRRVLKTGIDEQPVMYDERILGSGEFVRRLTEEHGLSGQMNPITPAPALVRQVAETLGISVDEIRRVGRSKAVTYARSVICYIGFRKMGHSGEAIARELGITRSGVCKRALTGEKLFREDERLRKIFQD